MLLRYVLQIIGSLVVMFILSPAITGVLLAVVPIIAIVAVLYGTCDLDTYNINDNFH